jgi:hypothetical protein
LMISGIGWKGIIFGSLLVVSCVFLRRFLEQKRQVENFMRMAKIPSSD